MDTSKSSKEAGEYIGGASIFSGRPDPTWKIDEREAKRLEELWSSLELFKGQLPSAPLLGYRGCFLRRVTTNREWFAYGGVVALKATEGSESRHDKNREFEKAILSSAPEGTIPTSFLDRELKQ